MITYLVFLPLNALGDGSQNTLDVSVERGLLPVTADEGELSDEGDGAEDLAVGRRVGAGGHLWVSAGRHDRASEEEDGQRGGFHCYDGACLLQSQR